MWDDSTSLKVNNPPLSYSPEGSLSQDCDGLALQEECTATCTESYEAKSSATASTTQICHFDGYTHADMGLQFSTTFVAVFGQHHRPERKVRRALIARTRLLMRLASWVAPRAASLLLATVSERSRVSARTRALSAWLGRWLLAG